MSSPNPFLDRSLPELSPELKALAEKIVDEGPLGIVALAKYIAERTGTDARWDAVVSEAMRILGVPSMEDIDLDDGLIYRVKITLKGTRPAVFREVEVPNMTLGEFHDMIQIAMGWEDAHPHCYTIGSQEYGPIYEGQNYVSWDDEEAVSLGQLLNDDQRRFTYEYDFGDSWIHDILISAKTHLPQRGAFYPRCVKGALACPPEDCGGIPGYADLCEIAKTPKADLNERQREFREWSGKYDPEKFSLNDVNKSLRKAFADWDTSVNAPQTRRK